MMLLFYPTQRNCTASDQFVADDLPSPTREDSSWIPLPTEPEALFVHVPMDDEWNGGATERKLSLILMVAGSEDVEEAKERWIRCQDHDAARIRDCGIMSRTVAPSTS
jgi:hypothetical protein